jgi:hypothetical protein
MPIVIIPTLAEKARALAAAQLDLTAIDIPGRLGVPISTVKTALAHDGRRKVKSGVGNA